ncbi:MAG: hypothetical protein AAGG72_08925 [Pseudomonadota bacterium]
MKTLKNTDASGTNLNVPDVIKWGHPDRFQLLCKASSETEGWMKSTKAMSVHGGCIVQVTTQQRNPDGSYALAEAVTFVPGVTVHSMTGEGGVTVDRWLGADAQDDVELQPAY